MGMVEFGKCSCLDPSLKVLTYVLTQRDWLNSFRGIQMPWSGISRNWLILIKVETWDSIVLFLFLILFQTNLKILGVGWDSIGKVTQQRLM